jgi:ElaB/YqjD/DUF883 family membrane-anchored ribosome-binding protein
MDQRAHDVEEDLKNILQTRLALADKIQTLERHVEATVESTKHAAIDALDLARNKAAAFIESTTHQLDPTVQAGRRPWMMVGGAVAVGLFAGLLEQRRRASAVYRYYPPEAQAADVMPEDGRSDEPRGVYPFYGREQPHPYVRTGRAPDDSQHLRSPSATSDFLKPWQTLWNDLSSEVLRERDRLQDAVLETGRSLIHDVVRMAGQSLIDQLSRPPRLGEPRQGQRQTRFG